MVNEGVKMSWFSIKVNLELEYRGIRLSLKASDKSLNASYFRLLQIFMSVLYKNPFTVTKGSA